MTMTLKAIAIRRLEAYETGYKASENKIVGKITLDGLHSEVNIKLSDRQCREIVAIVSHAAQDTAREAAEAMTAEVFNLPTTAQLESDIPF